MWHHCVSSLCVRVQKSSLNMHHHHHHHLQSQPLLQTVYVATATSQIKQTNCTLLFFRASRDPSDSSTTLTDASPETGINPPISNSAEAICFFQRYLVFLGDLTGLSLHATV